MLNIIKKSGHRRRSRQVGALKALKAWRIGTGACLVLGLTLTLSPPALGQAPDVNLTDPPAPEEVNLPQSVPDPLEPLNRAMWAFNQRLLTGVVKPTSRVYQNYLNCYGFKNKSKVCFS